MAHPVADPDPTADESFLRELPRKSRIRLYWLLAGCALLVLVPLALVVFSDEDPPDISDLAFTSREVPEVENFYLAAVKWSKAINPDPDNLLDQTADTLGTGAVDSTESADSTRRHKYSTERHEWREALYDGKGWTPALRDELRPKLEPFAREFLRIVDLPATQAPLHRSLEAEYEYGQFSQGWQAVRLAAWMAYSDYDYTGAARLALAGLRGAQRIMASEGPLTVWRVAVVRYRQMTVMVHDMAARPESGPDFVRALLEGVGTASVKEDGYVASVRHEASAGLAALQSFSREARAAFFSSTFRSPEPPPAIETIHALARPLVYKRNRTMRLYADQARRALRVTDATLAELAVRLPEKGELPDTGNWKVFHPSNLIGRVVLYMQLPSFRRAAEVRLAYLSCQSALRAFLAARLHELEHGELPATLDDLVPGYLPAVPLDYIDRRPIRYDRDLRAVWSLGMENLTTPPPVPGKNEIWYKAIYRFPAIKPEQAQ
ncbi:MAG: hypothetical protein LBK99_01385 [Opitutaceae bacterium]|nr:hypothetical protein [Opitutaceae bacterium]